MEEISDCVFSRDKMSEYPNVILQSILKKNKVIGLNQTIKSIEKKLIDIVVLAMDAETDFKQKIETMCKVENIKIISIASSLILAGYCKIEVPCAVVGILK